MGAGKTVTTLTAIRELLADGHLHRVLVVAPLRVATLVWKQDAASWAHLQGLNIAIACGDPTARLRAVRSEAQIVTINIENLPWLVECGSIARFDGIVFDEISRFKAPTGKRLKAVEDAVSKIKWRVGLTGSIRPHHIEDVFAPMKLITNDRPLGRNITAFRQKFCMADPYIRGRYHALPGAEALVAQAIKPWVYEITDEEYSAQLPELNLVRVPVAMPDAAAQVYRDMKYRYKAEGVEATNAGTAAMKLLQISSGFIYDYEPVLDAGGTPVLKDNGDPVMNQLVIDVHHAKVEALKELTADNPDTSMLIAYWFEEDLARIQAALGCPYLGSGVSTTEAERIMADWNAGKIKHLAVHPASVGHGINLQDGGNTIVWYTGTYSGDLHEQLIARLRRSGQASSTVTSLHLIASETDDLVLQTALGHISLQDAFVEYLRS